MDPFTLVGQIVDVIEKRIYPGKITIAANKITSITPDETIQSTNYLLPGFIDSHIHIESSMLIPSEFARLATVHGTVATVSDPHEIANVVGIEGIRYMIENGRQIPFHFYFGAPSCVPATKFETSGATIDAADIQRLFNHYHLHYLSEMMNFPGVLQRDPLIMNKIAISQRYHKPIDGHSPGMKEPDIKRYIEAGITTDHECFTLEEALTKIRYGMKILIREGSAAKNYEALHSLLKTHPSEVMFCSDDKHPHELVEGHINQLVKRSIVKKGYDTMDVLRAACYHPINHYKLEVGLLRPGDSADLIVVDNLHNFNVKSTYIQGQLVAQEGKTLIQSVQAYPINHFDCQLKSPADFILKAHPGKLRVIQVLENQLVTNQILMAAKIVRGNFVADTNRDLLKIAVVNRYHNAKPTVGFINQFGLKEGAIASCIAHDSHNIICVGTTDEAMCAAINTLIENKGGISVAYKDQIYTLPLSIAGIMSAEDGYQVAQEYVKINDQAKKLGTSLQAPFMTLSFMALLVIPSLKISDKGLFDVNRFAFTDLVVNDKPS